MNQAVSIAKALGIMLMVVAHAGCPSEMSDFIGLFHMPLFFFMSGYCFKVAYLDEAKAFLKKRVTGIYWPYLKWSLVFLLLHNVFCELNIYNGEYGFLGRAVEPLSLVETLKSAANVTLRMTGHAPLLGGYWFLKSLFFGSILFYVTHKLLNNSLIGGGGLLLAITLIASWLGKGVPLLGIGARETLAAFFMMMGHIYRSRSWTFHADWRFIAGAAVVVGVGSIFLHTSMLRFTHVELFPFVFFALTGTLMLFGVSQRVAAGDNAVMRWLSHVGGNTFHVLTWHFLCFKLVSLLIICIENRPIGQLACFPVIPEDIASTTSYANPWFLLYFVAGVGLPMLGVYIKDRMNARGLTLLPLKKSSGQTKR